MSTKTRPKTVEANFAKNEFSAIFPKIILISKNGEKYAKVFSKIFPPGHGRKLNILEGDRRQTLMQYYSGTRSNVTLQS